MTLFGFDLGRSKKQNKQEKALKSFVVPTFDDGAIPVEAGGFYGQYVDLDGTVRNDFELTMKYREMAQDPRSQSMTSSTSRSSWVRRSLP